MSTFVPHHYSHVTEGWRLACQLTDHVQHILGPTITDVTTGRTMDAGQAICREAYGVDWVDSPDFKAANAAAVAPDEYLAAARRLIAREPNWIASAVTAEVPA